MQEINTLCKSLSPQNAACLAGSLAVRSSADKIENVGIRYKDYDHYNTVLARLLRLQIEHSFSQVVSHPNVSVRWDSASEQIGTQDKAFFSWPSDRNCSTLQGDNLSDVLEGFWQITLRPSNSERTFKGWVVGIDQSDICIELRTPLGKFKPETSVCAVDLFPDTTPYERGLRAVWAIRKRRSMSASLKAIILGHPTKPIEWEVVEPEQGFNILGSPQQLNDSQLQAIRCAIQSPMSLIQGPPGTGKTATIVEIVFHMVRTQPYHTGNGRVLVAAPSNVAVDQLTEKLSARGLRVVRLRSKRAKVSGHCEYLTLDHQVSKLLEEQRLGFGYEAEDAKHKLKFEKETLEPAEVVVTTCVGAAALRSHQPFPQVVIDEATQASEPECLIPLVLGAKQVVLVGDPCQLGPVIQCKEAEEAGMSQSLFERLMLCGHQPLLLDTQYRMHPCISKFPSELFYGGKLKNGIEDKDRQSKPAHAYLRGPDFPWVNREKQNMFLSVCGREEILGTSFRNHKEAVMVLKAVTRFLKAGYLPRQIGVVTPYEAQRALIRKLMSQGSLDDPDFEHGDVEVKNVDGFQGREMDLIIYSSVRSNDKVHQTIKFASDPKRICVAMTRAKCGLLIIGNHKVLQSNAEIWRPFIKHYFDNGCLVSGPLNNLKRIKSLEDEVQSEPKVYNNDQGPTLPDVGPGGWLALDERIEKHFLGLDSAPSPNICPPPPPPKMNRLI